MAKPSDVKALRPSDTVREAAVKILWARFEDMWAFREAVIDGTDIEAIHDMRVASRRLRVAMQTFRSCFPGRSFRRHYRCVQQIADTLGEVRDRDVLIAELESDQRRLETERQAGVHEFVAELAAGRDAARESLRALLRRLDNVAYEREFLSYIARKG